MFQSHNLIPNSVAPLNIPDILVTLDTSQDEMSLLNDDAPLNISDIFTTPDTSQDNRSLLNDDAP